MKRDYFKVFVGFALALAMLLSPISFVSSQPVVAQAATKGEKAALKNLKEVMKEETVFSKRDAEFSMNSEFTKKEKKYAFKHCKIDWVKQALKCLEYYSWLSPSEWQCKGMLEEQGFTEKQINAAIKKCGYDWNEQASKWVKDCLDRLKDVKPAVTEEDIRGWLAEYQFTEDQIEYAMKANGF